MIVPHKHRAAADQALESLYGDGAGCSPWPAARDRLLARLRAASLDRELRAGVDPASCPLLAARASTLTSPCSRAALADGLERWFSAARGATSRSRVLPPRDLAAATEPEVRAIVAELRGSAPLYARGLAQLAGLLSDGTGPAYVGEPETLGGLLRETRAAIAGHGWMDPQ
jgi:hypothetical protein